MSYIISLAASLLPAGILCAAALGGCGGGGGTSGPAGPCISTVPGDVGWCYMVEEEPVLSADGSMVACVLGESRFLVTVDIATRQKRTIDLTKLAGDSIRMISIARPSWCPWSTDYLVLFGISSDLQPNGQTRTGAYPYIIHLPTLTTSRIDLAWSEKLQGGVPGKYSYYARWLPGSSRGNDTFLIHAYGGKPLHVEYHVQSRQVLESQTDPFAVWSRDRRRMAVPLPGRLLVNGVMVAVHHNLGGSTDISPDGRHVATIASDGRGGSGVKVVMVDLPASDAELEKASTWREIPISSLNCLFGHSYVAFISNDEFVVSVRKPFEEREELTVFGLDGISRGRLAR